MFALGVIGRTSRGRRALDGIVLAMPLAGSLLQKACLARFARTYSALIRGGIATPKALGIAAEATGNRAMADAFGAARAAVESGAPLASALGGRKYMPHTFIEMLRAGEKTGRTDEMLDSVAEYYESEVNTAVSTLPSIIMPLLIVVIGVVVGAIVVAALMPLFEAPGLVQ